MQINGYTNITAAIEEIDRLSDKADNLAPLFADIANDLFNMADEAFENETSPDGKSWQPLKPSTIKKKGHSRKLDETGHTRETLEYGSDNKSARVGTNAKSKDNYPYPAVQHFGTKDGRVPPREFLPFDQDGDLMDVAADSILDTVYEYFSEL